MRDLFVAKGAEYMRDRFGEDAPTIESSMAAAYPAETPHYE